MRWLLSLVAIASIASFCGCDDGGRDSLHETFTVPGGDDVELDLEMPAGSTVTARFSADGMLAWDVHSHGAAGVVTHDQGSGVSGDVIFVAPAAGEYSLRWESRVATPINLTLEVSFEGGGTIQSVIAPDG